MSTEEKAVQNEQEASLVIYEVGYLLLPTLPEEKLGEAVGALRGFVEKSGGAVITEDFPKMRALAYSMSKVIQTKKHNFDHAYFGWVKFEVASSEIAVIKKNIESLETILRSLFVKTVRENTLLGGRVGTRDAQAQKPQAENGEAKISAPADEAEIDKSIDALVIN